MDIKKVRQEFMIYVVDDEESIRDVLKEALQQSGYQCESFPTAEDGLKRVNESPPHLIFSDIRMPGMSGIQFLSEIRKLSADIEFIIMTSHASLETAVEAIKLGAYDYIFKPFENLQDVVATADRTIERVYMKLENEQLLHELHNKNKQLAQVNARITEENREVTQLNEFMKRLAAILDPKQVSLEILNTCYEAARFPFVFFLYDSPKKALVALSQVGIKSLPDGLGIPLQSYSVEKIAALISQPEQFKELGELCHEVFDATDFLALPLVSKEGPLGLLIGLGSCPKSSNLRRLIESFVQAGSVSFDNAQMTRKIQEMAIRDPLTGLYNRRFFNEKLAEEISRSQRTQYPLSMIYLDIDHFKKYNDQNGHPMGDVLLKSVAHLLQKSSRNTDIVARLGGEEFAIVCPYTAAQGAAIKAEKARLIIERTKFPFGEKQPLGKVSASFGVSEYPSFAGDAESLVRLADDALYQVKQAGRNRVCMAQPPPGYKPEFTPLPVPVTSKKPNGITAA